MPPPRRSPKRSGTSKLGWIIVAAAFAVLIFKIGLAVRSSDHAAALESQARQKSLIALETKKINSVIAANPGISFSVSVKVPVSGIDQHYGVNGPMEAASVGKLVTAALFLHRDEEGLDSLTEQISGVSARQLIRAMVNQSDDNSWQILNGYLGHLALNIYASSLGMKDYDADTNNVSTDDMALLLDKLGSGHLLGSSDTSFLLSAMHNTNYEDLISPAVPPGAAIYHKVGEVDDNVNDAAIITRGDQKVVLIIFTDGHGNQDWPARAQLIQQISRSVFAAFF